MSRHSSKASPLPISNPAAMKANALTKPQQSRASRGLRVSFLISIGRSRSFSFQARTRSSCVVRQPAHRSRPF